jgi:MFS family permease
MFGGIGRALGPIAAGAILDHWKSAGYVWVYLLCAASGALSFGLTMLIPAAPTEHRHDHPWGAALSDLAAVARHPRMMIASIARMVQSSSQGALLAFFPIYGRDMAHLSEGTIGLLVGTNHVVSLISRPVTAVLSSRAGRIPFMVVGMLAQGAALVLVVCTTEFWMLLPLFSLTGICEAVVQIATIAYVADLAGKKLFGAAIGVVGSFFDIGLVAGKLVPGWLIPLLGGYVPAFGIVGGIIGVCSLLSFRFLKETELDGPRVLGEP